MKSALWILLLGVLAFTARCYNVRQALIAGHIYFVDGDCYARMTRARIIDQAPGTIIHHHDFENFPDGVRSHTTAPMDYAIVGLKRLLELTSALWSKLPGAEALKSQTLDLAGALISPLFGALTCMYLAWWTRWGLVFPAGSRWPKIVVAGPLFFAICPILVHSAVLGRPDHQAPMILFLTLALTAELTLLQRTGLSMAEARPIIDPGQPANAGAETHVPPDVQRKPVPLPHPHTDFIFVGLNHRVVPIVAGAGWAMALWISLYEPLILLIGTAVFLLAFERWSLRNRARFWELGVLAGIVGLMLLIEGSLIPSLSPEVKEYFPRWSKTVGELNRLDLRGDLLYRWLGWGCLAAPVLLFLAATRLDRRAWFVLALLLGMFAATCWHLRWGYFVALAYALSLPWQLAVLRRRWIAWVAFCISMLPLAVEWDALLFPKEDSLEIVRRERALLRQMADRMRGEGVRPFLAPWWLSPALAYWTDQPGVTGSSHEGLPGIVDSARFYLAQEARPAADILSRRHIALVLIDDPARTLATSAPLLEMPVPARSLGETLYRTPHSGPSFLVLSAYNQYYKLFEVDLSKLPP